MDAKDDMAEKIRQVLLGGQPKMDADGVPFSGLAGVIAEALWQGGYRDTKALMGKLVSMSERVEDDMKVSDDYQRGFLHGIRWSVGTLEMERRGVDVR